MIFMFDAGMNSLPAFLEYSVSPVRGLTISTPHCAFLNSGCDGQRIDLDAGARLRDDAAGFNALHHGDAAAEGERRESITSMRAAGREIFSNTICELLPAVGGAQAVVSATVTRTTLAGFGSSRSTRSKMKRARFSPVGTSLPSANSGDVEIDVAVIEPLPSPAP